METNKKTNAELLRQYAVEAKQAYFRKISLRILLVVAIISELFRYIDIFTVDWEWIFFGIVALGLVSQIASVFITVKNEKTHWILSITKRYLDKEMLKNETASLKQHSRLNNPRASKSQIHKSIIEINESRSLYKKVLTDISVLLV